MVSQIDISGLNRQSHSRENEALARSFCVPALKECVGITEGPTAKMIGDAPVQIVPDDIARILGLYGGFGENRVDPAHICATYRVPLQFTLDNESSPAIGVFIEAIDYHPDKTLYPTLLDQSEKHSPREHQVVIRGWFIRLHSRNAIEASLKKCKLMPCFIGYDLGKKIGNFAEIADVQDLPKTQVIKDLSVFQRVINLNFINGFMESFAPDKRTRWGRVAAFNSTCDDSIELSVMRLTSLEWKFPRTQSGLDINLIGVTCKKDRKVELLGDVILSSDGTLLHSYHFSREKRQNEFPSLVGKAEIPTNWHDGYYFNRFYPHDSVMVPEEVRTSFERVTSEEFRI